MIPAAIVIGALFAIAVIIAFRGFNKAMEDLVKWRSEE